MNKAQEIYFKKQIMNFKSGNMTEEDSIQMFQDLVNTGIGFMLDQETSVHCRLLVKKGIINASGSIRERFNLEVSSQEVQLMVDQRIKLQRLQ